MSEVLKIISEHASWIFSALGVVGIIMLLIVGYKVFKGTANISIWGIKIESNKALLEVQKQFELLNEHSEHKTQVLKLLNQANLTLSQWENARPEQFESLARSFYNFFLPGIITLITKQKANAIRAAVFHLKDDKLVILHGFGYSPNGVKNLKLSLQESKAGYCFTEGREYYNSDVTLDPTYVRNPKSSKLYKSVLCIPITYNNKTIGVLNLDGLDSNSFDKDDIDYITYFANSISPLLFKELIYRDFSREKEEAFNHEEHIG